MLDPEIMKRLENLRVVLVETKFPGNIGSAARAMKNTGFSDLRLVKPRAELSKEAYTMAVGGSAILDEARIHKSLAEAVSDCGIVIGTSRRVTARMSVGAGRQPTTSPAGSWTWSGVSIRRHLADTTRRRPRRSRHARRSLLQAP